MILGNFERHFGYFGRPESYFGGFGLHFEEFLDFGDFRDAAATKKYFHLNPKLSSNPFFVVLFF